MELGAIGKTCQAGNSKMPSTVFIRTCSTSLLPKGTIKYQLSVIQKKFLDILVARI